MATQRFPNGYPEASQAKTKGHWSDSRKRAGRAPTGQF
jgi:hypothetical protein